MQGQYGKNKNMGGRGRVELRNIRSTEEEKGEKRCDVTFLLLSRSDIAKLDPPSTAQVFIFAILSLLSDVYIIALPDSPGIYAA